MKKAVKKVKEKTGCFVDRLRIRSRSQSPAPVDRHLSPVSSAPPPPKLHAENLPQFSQRAVAESTAIQPHSPLTDDPMSPAQSTNEPGHNSLRVEPCTPLHPDPSAHTLSKVAHLSSNISLNQMPIIFNNNQNTTYNFGRDVINNNWITNNIYLTQEEENALKAIKTAIGNRFVPAALHDAQPEDAGCMPGTRLRVLSRLMDWAKSDSMRIFWLAGLAGTGKTSIAITLCRMLQDEPSLVLGGTFFCSRTANIIELTDVRCVLPTLAASLAEKSSSFGDALAKQLNNDSRAALKPISSQIVSLLEEPLAVLASSSYPIVFVVDALDECSDETEVKKFLQAISTLKCSAIVKFVLTSRHPRHRITKVAKGAVAEDFVGCKHRSGDWNTRRDTDTEELEETKQVLACILVARVPLSVRALAELLHCEAIDLHESLKRLQAVVHVPDEYDQPGLRTLHASFGDFLLERAASRIRISPLHGDDGLARGCLRLLRKRLHFNISQTSSSYEPNLPATLDSISLSLKYACMQWVYHVAKLPRSPILDDEIYDILRPQFMFWLEVMSVLGQVQRAAAMLLIAGATARLTELCRFLRDASTFVASFRDAIERSSAHIYLSALPFVAKNSMIYTTYAPLCIGLVSVETFGTECHGERVVLTLTGHENEVNSVAYSPDGHVIASGSTDGTVRIWDTRSGEELISPLGSNASPVNSVAFSPNGRSLAVGAESKDVLIWDILVPQKSPRRLCGHSMNISSVTFSPDGLFLASASTDQTIRFWRTETGQQINVMQGHVRLINTVVFSPAGDILASGSDDRTIRSWRSITGESVGLPLSGHNGGILSLSFSSDDATLASGSEDCDIRLWKLQDGECIAILRGHSGRVLSVQFSPDGMTLASAAQDRSVRIWSLQQDAEEPPSIVLEGASPVYSVTFSPNGLYVASGAQDSTVRIWDVASHQHAAQPTQTYGSKVWAVDVSADGGFIVSGSDECSVRIWSTSTGGQMLPPLLGHTVCVFSVATSTDGRLIASASGDRTVRLWNAQTGDAIGEPLQGHEEEIRTIAFSSNSQWLVSGSDDRTVRLWNVATNSSASIGPLSCNGWVLAVAFSPDNRLVAAGDYDGMIYLWDRGSGQLAHDPLYANEQFIQSIAFSTAGTHLVSGGKDRIGRVWDISKGRQTLALEGHNDSICSIRWSPINQLIGTGSDDCTVRLWNAVTGAQLAILHGHSDAVISVAFTPNGQSIVSGSWDSTIRVWDVNEALLQLPDNGDDIATALKFARLENGWLLSRSGALLLWVPPKYRAYLDLPSCTVLVAERRVVITSGKNLHCGDNWKACWREKLVT